jgi:hypothetical protein
MARSTQYQQVIEQRIQTSEQGCDDRLEEAEERRAFLKAGWAMKT